MFLGQSAYSTYKPNPRQAIFHNILPYAGSSRVIKGYLGALGGGKSTACMQEQALIALQTPGGNSLCGRKEKEKAKKTLRDEYQKLIAPVSRWVASDSYWKFDNGHKLWLVPFDEWDSVGSFEIVSWYGQEFQEVNAEIFQALNQRLRQPEGVAEGVPWYRGLFDARGVRKNHWLWKDFVSKAWNVEDGPDARKKARNPDYVYVRARTKDNIQNLRPGYYDEMVRDHADDVAWQKMMLEGEFGFDIQGRPVYESYNPRIHDAEITPDPTLPILRGWDFGYNQPAVVFCQYTRSGRLLVLGEMCPTGVSREELASLVESYQAEHFHGVHPSQYRDYGDWAGKHENSAGVSDIEFIENRFRTSIETRNARIKDGLEVVRTLMSKLTRRGEPRFAIDLKAERLREALSGAYYYRTDKTDDRPTKGEGYDDVADALRYVAQLVVEEAHTTDESGDYYGQSESLRSSIASY